VIVDAEHLLLVRRELSARALDTEEQGERHGMRGTRQREANAMPRTATATVGAGACGQGRVGNRYGTHLESKENGMGFGAQADRC